MPQDRSYCGNFCNGGYSALAMFPPCIADAGDQGGHGPGGLKILSRKSRHSPPARSLDPWNPRYEVLFLINSLSLSLARSLARPLDPPYGVLFLINSLALALALSLSLSLALALSVSRSRSRSRSVTSSIHCSPRAWRLRHCVPRELFSSECRCPFGKGSIHHGHCVRLSMSLHTVHRPC
jgi:hypothetical protein